MEIAKDKLEWLEYDLLKPYSHIIQKVYLRHGGTSKGNFASLNLGKDVGDHPDNVKANREIVSQSTHLPKIIYATQVHGVGVHQVTPHNVHQNIEADALFTSMHDTGLAITHADCQAILFYDPKNEVVAVAHVGWKGSVQNIIAVLIDALHTQMHTDPSDLFACISPSLCSDHAEFTNYQKEFPEELWSFQTKEKHFDLLAITKMQLRACGVLEKNMEFTEICTACNPKDYFSYRLEKKTGRHASIIAIQS